MREREEIQVQLPVSSEQRPCRCLSLIRAGNSGFAEIGIGSDFQFEVGRVFLRVAGEPGCLGGEPAAIVGI